MPASLDDSTLLTRRKPRRLGSWPRVIWKFFALTGRKTRRDDLILQSAALAFVTIFSLIPLLAAFSYVAASTLRVETEEAVEILSQILPYSEEAILSAVQQFVNHAQTYGPVGFIVFILTALAAFSTVEETVNRIWNVPKRRSLRSRLLSFTLVVFWGPLLIGATYSALFYLEQQPALEGWVQARPLQLMPFVVTGLGLSMLYWMVPYTAVRFRSAFAGGLAAALLLEGLRELFALYVQIYLRFSFIYGSFGLVLLFLIAIQLAWWIVLLGSEIAYCLQNFRLLAFPRRPAAAFDGTWLGLAALVVVTDRFRRGKPITPHEVLAERLRLAVVDLPVVLEPLVERELLHESGGETEGYLLACDPYQMKIDEIFACYEPLHQEVLERLDDDLASNLRELRDRLNRARRREGAKATLAELVSDAPAPADPRESTAGPQLAARGTRG